MKPLSRLKMVGLFVAWAVASIACSAPAPAPSFGVRFRIISDDGVALSGAVVSARGQAIGKTNTLGELDAKLDGSEGETVPIAIQCGPEYRSLDHAPELRLTRIRRISNGPGTSGIPYDASCTRVQRNVVVVAHADKLPGIPVLVEGKQVALTDSNGNAEVLIQLATDTTLLHVAFETGARPELLPKNPGRAYDVAPGDDIVTLEQKFSVAAKPIARRLQVQSKHVPVRIE